SILRFLVDFTRFYGADERLASLSHNQVVCIVLFVIFGGFILKGFLFKEDQPSVNHSTPAADGPGTSTQAHP
ncbi:MAG: hypothetical protein JXA71_01170, partial [Chitinispirillaceae bacterium]|nr:hypothetical protein [Chitinispirillaceae bacterium]